MKNSHCTSSSLPEQCDDVSNSYSVYTVSYTHLDVYKRQPLACVYVCLHVRVCLVHLYLHVALSIRVFVTFTVEHHAWHALTTNIGFQFFPHK